MFPVVTGRCRALTIPAVTVELRPSGEPIAITHSPTRRRFTSPKRTAGRPVASVYCVRPARSALADGHEQRDAGLAGLLADLVDTPGNRIEVIGQIDSMNSAFRDLAIGIALVGERGRPMPAASVG